MKSNWQIGIELFNEGKFWEAHECFEQDWLKLPEPSRTQIQAVIQVAAVFYLFEKGRSRPALSLSKSSLEKFRVARTATLSGGARPLPWVQIEGIEEALTAILEDEERWLIYRKQLKASLISQANRP